MASIGYATLTVAPSIKGLQNSLQKQLGGVMPQVGQRAGQTMGAGVNTGLRRGLGKIPGFNAVAAAATSAASTMRTTFGRGADGVVRDVDGIGASFRQMGTMAAAAVATIGIAEFAGQVKAAASGLQDTAAILDGLYQAAGHGAGEASTAMRMLNREFSQSGIAMSAFQQGATDLAYLGLNAAESVDIMKLLEATISATGGSAEEMGSVTGALQTMQNQGKATLDQIQVISNSGVPILDMLADKLGVDVPEAMAMITAGAVDVNDVIGSMQDRGGTWADALIDSADNLNYSFSSAWDSIRNTVVNGLAQQVLPLLDKSAPRLLRVRDAIAGAFDDLPGKLAEVGDLLEESGVTASLRALTDGAKEFVQGATPIIKGFGEGFGVVLVGLVNALRPVGDLLERVGQWMQDNEQVVRAFGQALGVLVGLFAAFKSAAAIGGVLAGLTNPIGWVILAVAGLAAGLKYAWENSETFRDIITGAWDAIQSGAQKVSDFFTQDVWPVLRDGWSELSDAAGPAIQKMLDWFTDLEGGASAFAAVWGPIWDGVKEKFRIVWDGLAPIARNVLDQVKAVFDIFTGIFEGDWQKTWDGAKEFFSLALDNLVTVAKTWGKTWWSNIKTWFSDLPSSIRDWLGENVPVIAAKLKEWADEFVDWAEETGPKVLDGLQQMGADIADWIADDLPPILEEKLNEAQEAVVEWAEELPGKIKDAIDDAADVQQWLVEWGPKLLKGLVIAFGVVIVAIPALVLGIGALLVYLFVSIVNRLRQRLKEKFQEMLIELGQLLFEGVTYLRNNFSSLPGKLASLASDAKTRVANQFTAMKDDALNRMSGMRDGALARARGLRDMVSGVFNEFKNKAIQAFHLAYQGISVAWGKIQGATRKPVEFVVNTVYNNGIKRVWNHVAGLVDMDPLPGMKFQSGGILPGYTPGRDPHKFYSPTGGALELSGGEAIMRPEVTRVLGSGGVNSLNKAARTGGVGGVRRVMGFARGGVYQPQRFNRGGILGRVDEFGKQAKDLFADVTLKGAAGKVLNPLIDQMDQFRDTRWGTAVAKLPETMIGKFLTWLEKVIDPKLGGDAGKVVKLARSKIGNFGGSDYSNEFTRAFGMPGQPWCAMFVSKIFKDAKAQKAINNIWSAGVWDFNRGMKKITRGNVRTGDLATYRGSGHINIVTDAKRKETVGGNESNRVRKQFGYMNTATAFLRSKFAAGGVLDKRFLRQDMAENSRSTTPPLTQALRLAHGIPAYDQGGMLKPGLQLVYNGTGRPETVRTAAQEERVERLVAALEAGGVGGHVINVEPPPATVSELVDGVSYALRRSRMGGKYAAGVR